MEIISFSLYLINVFYDEVNIMMKKKKSPKKKTANFFTKMIKATKKGILFFFTKLENFRYTLFLRIEEIGKKNRRVFEVCQLTIIYFLGIFQILLACLQFSGSVPQLYKSLPFFHELVYSPFGFFFSNPDRTYIFYLLAQELIVLRSHIFKFSLIVRYSILYIMTLEFLFYCIINWWDILCNFENDLIFKVHVDRAFSTELCLTLFAIYFCIYLYSYIRALNRKLPVFPNPILQKIPDSVAFWLQIKPDKETKKNKK